MYLECVQIVALCCGSNCIIAFFQIKIIVHTLLRRYEHRSMYIIIYGGLVLYINFLQLNTVKLWEGLF